MKRFYLIFSFILLVSGMISVQFFFDRQKEKQKYVEPMIIRPEIAKVVDLGMHNIAADLEWLGAIQYFGGGESEDYARLPDYLNFAADLDPKFSYPYAFGALVLPSIGYVDQGLALAQKGIDNRVEDWRIPYYAATTYYINKNDNANAAKYFDIAANTPGVPDNIQKIAARFGNRSDKVEQTKQIWTGIYETTKDEVVKKRAENYIIHLEIVELLNQAKDQYFKAYKKYPMSTEELVSGKILKSIPPDPFGFTYSFDEKGNLSIK